jgi:hypothetical protein
MRDGKGQPQGPWSFDFGSPWKPGRVGRHDEPVAKYEPFPRLDDIEHRGRKHEAISSAWGWLPLCVFLLLFASLLFAPEVPTEEGSDETADIGLGLVILGCLLCAYIAGSTAAFKGARKGITWTLVPTALFALIAIVAALDEEGVGGDRVLAVAVAGAATFVHLGGAYLVQPRHSES